MQPARLLLPPWDPGLQNERTGLAWQRTMLSGLACGLLVARLLASISVVFATAVGVSAVLGTAALGWLAISRFREASAALHAGHPIGDGRTPAMVTALLFVTGAGALLYVLF